MIWFKTRHEVKQARKDIEDLREMIRAHFDIKFTLEDFQKWANANPSAGHIPTSVGELLHYVEILSPTVFRGMPLKAKQNKSK